MSEMVWVVCHPHSWPLSPDPAERSMKPKSASCPELAGSGVKLQELKDASFLTKPQATERKQ